MKDETRTDETSKLDPQSLGYRRIALLQQQLGRRSFLGGATGLTAAAIGLFCLAPGAPVRQI